MKFAVGDRVRSVALPPFVGEDEFKVGSEGVVKSLWSDDRLDVAFDNGDEFWFHSHQVELAKPLPTIEEALAGIVDLLDD